MVNLNPSNGDNDAHRLTGVTRVGDNDIICGRGGLALKHPGNISYRKIVGLNKELYATCLKTEKLRISKSIVAAIREINGRFLEREDGKTSKTLEDKDENGNPVTWKDIGDKRAIEKTSQALREGQPKLLKKLAAQQNQQDPNSNNNAFNGAPVGATVGNNALPLNGQFNMPQSQMMPPQQFNNIQPMQQNFNHMQQQPQAPAQIYAGSQQQQMAMQNAFQQAQQRPSFTAQQRGSLTLQSLVEGQAFSSFPRNSFVENGMQQGQGDRSNSQMTMDSWGSQTLAPLLDGSAHQRPGYGRSNSRDSWGEEDPTPLLYHDAGGSNGALENEHVFSSDDQKQLMTALDVEGQQGNAASHGVGNRHDNKRPSVKFQVEPQRPSMSGMSLSSHLSEMSIFSDTLSLDSAMDAAQRQAEFEMLGEFDTSEIMSIGTFEDLSSSGHTPVVRGTRRSILRKSNKWQTTAAFPPAPLNHHVDPGLIFTSTLDVKPGGLNSGTDVSGLMGERRKSVVAFEVDVNRRRSSRMSMCSALTDFSGMFKRDIGSVLSIQSADFRELMADIDSDDDSDDDRKQS